MKLVLMHAEVSVSKFFTCRAISSGVKAINAVIVEEICNGKWTKSGNFKRLNFGSGKGRISFKCAQAIMISWLMWEENGKTDGWDLNSRCSSQIQVVVEESTERNFLSDSFTFSARKPNGRVGHNSAELWYWILRFIISFDLDLDFLLYLEWLVWLLVKWKGKDPRPQVR